MDFSYVVHNYNNKIFELNKDLGSDYSGVELGKNQSYRFTKNITRPFFLQRGNTFYMHSNGEIYWCRCIGILWVEVLNCYCITLLIDDGQEDFTLDHIIRNFIKFE